MKNVRFFSEFTRNLFFYRSLISFNTYKFEDKDSLVRGIKSRYIN